MKAHWVVKRITFHHSEASPSETLYVSVPMLNKVLIPGLLALLSNIDLEGGHANNFLVQNVSCTLVDKLVVKYMGTILQDMVGYDIFLVLEDLLLTQDERGNMLPEGIQRGHSATSAQNLETRTAQVSTRKTSWKRFTEQNTESYWTTRS